MTTSYEGFESIYSAVVLGHAEWPNRGAFDTVAEIWEKKFIKKSRLNSQDRAYLEVYADAIKDYTNLVVWYSNLSEDHKNTMYQEWSKKTMLTKIKYSV